MSTESKRVAKELLHQIWYSVPTPQVHVTNYAVSIEFLVGECFIAIVVEDDGWGMWIDVGPYSLVEFDLQGSLDNTKLTEYEAWPYKRLLQIMATKVNYPVANNLHLLDA